MGVRAGALLPPVPELGIEARAGSALLFQNLGVDLVYRPIASLFDFSPRVRVGIGGIHNTFKIYGGPSWLAELNANIGMEYRGRDGLLFAVDGGVSLLSKRLALDSAPPGLTVVPNLTLSFGYAF